MLNEQQKGLITEPELIPTAKERAVIQIMRTSKQNRDVFLNIMGLLHQKDANNKKLNRILKILEED